MYYTSPEDLHPACTLQTQWVASLITETKVQRSASLFRTVPSTWEISPFVRAFMPPRVLSLLLLATKTRLHAVSHSRIYFNVVKHWTHGYQADRPCFKQNTSLPSDMSVLQGAMNRKQLHLFRSHALASISKNALHAGISGPIRSTIDSGGRPIFFSLQSDDWSDGSPSLIPQNMSRWTSSPTNPS